MELQRDFHRSQSLVQYSLKVSVLNFSEKEVSIPCMQDLQAQSPTLQNSACSVTYVTRKETLSSPAPSPIFASKAMMEVVRKPGFHIN